MASTDKSPFVIIIGLNSLQGLQAARIFAARGIPVLAMTDDPDHFCCRTKVCREIIVTETRGAGFIEELERRAVDFREPPVLVPCQDESVLQLSRNRQRLDKKYRFLLPPADAVEALLDKTRFYRLAEAHGGVVPQSMMVHDQNDFERAVVTIPFPCIVKPSGRSSIWSANTIVKAFKVDDAEELRRLYAQCRHWCAALVVQEWIPGTDAALFSCNVYFNAAGEPLVTFVARKLRQWLPEVGESCLGQECRNDEVLNETLRLFKGLNFCGLGYLELKRDRRCGRYVIMEANIGRPTGRSAIAEAGGVELLQTMYCDLSGQPLPLARQQQYTGVKWIHLTRDCASALHYWKNGALTLSGWWHSLRGKKVYAVFSWRDPAPFIGDLTRAVRMLLSPRERQRRIDREAVKKTEEVKSATLQEIPVLFSGIHKERDGDQ
jgi:predicted ATP-grasp superfamily ATP-dependent carboligase